MAYNSDVRKHIQVPESNKFVEITNDTRFPVISVTRYTSPNQAGMQPVSSIETYSKYALLTYDTGSANNTVNGSPFGDNSSVDAFGRLRVSNPKTLFDAKQLSDKLPQFFDEALSGAATSTWVPGDSLTLMTTSSAGDYAIRQTSMHFNYQPGKSLLANFTGVFNPQTNVTKRIGLFQGLSSAPYTPTDGIFIESTDGSGGYIAFRVLKTAGIPYSLSATQPNWNLDKLDGTGASGIKIDFNSAVLMVIDYEWLSVGRVRCGFNIGGRTFYAHQFTNIGTLSAPYMTSGNQPVRYEIRQTGAGSGYLKHICSSVMSEGGEDYIGTSLTCEASAAVTIDSQTLFRPVLGIRLDPAAHDLSLVAKTINVLNAGVGDVYWKVIQNPTINGGTLTYRDTLYNNNVQFAQGSNTLSVSGGYDLMSGYAESGSRAAATGSGRGEILGELAVLGTKINGTPDTIVLAARSLKNASDGSLHGAIDMVLRG